MTSVRNCPDCKGSLQSFPVTPPSGAELELERCTQCGGVWCEWSRLHAAFGEAVRPKLIGGDTHRRCPLCRILLTPALLPDGLTVEKCSACQGIYLDAGELQQLGGRERQTPRLASALPQPPAAKPAPAREKAASTVPKHSFRCVRCGQLKPLREGQAFREGLACRACMRAVSEEGSGLDLRALLLGRSK